MNQGPNYFNRRKWLSGKAAPPETVPVVAGIAGKIVLLRQKPGQSCRERLFSILSSQVGVTCFSLHIKA
jgi:hypothetical protein